MKPTLLLIGDAACDSGFARGTHAYADGLAVDYEVHILGLNYRGDPHDYPYKIYPAYLGGDGFGVGRLKELLPKIQPSVIVIQNDPWNFLPYLDEIDAYVKETKQESIPVVGIVAVDGKNCRSKNLNKCRSVVFWTHYGLEQARLGGYHGPAHVVPLGVNLEAFNPLDRTLARAHLFGQEVENEPTKRILPRKWHEAFIVGNVNRNQPRKRLDLTIEYFAEWVKSYDVKNAYLYMHVCPTGDQGWDILQLMKYYGVMDRLILVEPGVFKGVSDEMLRITYASMNVLVSTTQGEGMGLPAMEAMAMGIPTIGPDWAAYGDWAKDAMMLVPCTGTAATFDNINAIGGVVGKDEFIAALQLMYADEETRRTYGERGLNLMARPEYRWESVGKGVADAVRAAMTVEEPVGVEA